MEESDKDAEILEDSDDKIAAPASPFVIYSTLKDWILPGPYLKTLKHVHTEQVARLQAKNQHECDLLEDIRNFTKQRSVIEKTYAEALLKVSSAYLNKKIPSIPDLRDEDEDEKWNVWNVWRTVLEENEKLARARLAAVEVFQQQITDDAKTIRQAKLQASRKCLEQLQTVQKELQNTVGELDRQKKFYFEEEHMAHDARVKASDAEEKLKKKKGSIFSSFTSLQRSSVKLSTKKETCEEKSTGARNEYILALAQANAHQDRYYNNDMDTCLRTLEGDVYEKLREYLTVIGRTELLTCSAAQNSFYKIRDQAQMLSRDYNVACCVQYYPVLKQNISYPFEPCDGDNCRKITTEHASAATLTMEAKNWANRIGKQVKIIRENQRKLKMFLDLKEAGHKSDPDDPNGPDIDIKLDDIRENIRRAETDKLRAESVIFCFRDAGINVEEFMKDIEALVATLEIQRSASSTSLNRDSVPEKQNRVETYYDSDSQDSPSPFEKVKTVELAPADSPEPTEVSIDARVEEARQKAAPLTWDDPTKVDWGDESEAVVIEEPARSPPADISQIGHGDSWPHDSGSEPGVVRCVALYSYTAQNPDELTIVENEHMDLLGEGDGDGWVRARNYKGEEGYVPQNYVEVEGNPTVAGYPLQPQISFSSVDYHVQDMSHATDQDEVTMMEDIGQPNGIANGYPEEAEVEEYYNESNLPEEIQIPTAPTTVSSGLTTPFINECRGEEGNFCRALYDYEATAPEELSFYEGQIIRITKYTPHDEEDGWWEGEYDGQRGLFPSIVCDECHWDGEPLTPAPIEIEEEEEELSESGMNPPAYTPPQIPEGQVPPETDGDGPTEAVPVLEDAQAQEEESESEVQAIDKANFEMELNLDQQQKYQTQFDEQAEAISVVVTEAPEIMVEITVTEPEKSGDGDENTEDGSGDSGLEVTQIVITAATPMTEEHKAFPGGDSIIEEEDEDMLDDDEGPPPLPQVTPPGAPIDLPIVIEQDMDLEQGFADFSQMGGGSSESSGVPQSTSKDQEPVTESVSAGTSDEVTSDLPPSKTSLDIEDENRFLRGESKESMSPVTPDELELHNLAKLESLKESDA